MIPPILVWQVAAGRRNCSAHGRSRVLRRPAAGSDEDLGLVPRRISLSPLAWGALAGFGQAPTLATTNVLVNARGHAPDLALFLWLLIPQVPGGRSSSFRRGRSECRGSRPPRHRANRSSRLGAFRRGKGTPWNKPKYNGLRERGRLKS
jgi:hypothetical protein